MENSPSPGGVPDARPIAQSPHPEAHGTAAAAAPSDSPKLTHKALEDFAQRANNQIGVLTNQARAQEAVIQHLSSRVQVLAEAQASQASAAQPAAAVYKDDQRRRLIEFLGYEPDAQQQMKLFTAFASWQATEPRLVENRFADYKTDDGRPIQYGYADLAGVIATGQTAASFGLFAFTRQELDDNGTPVVTGYVVHAEGGAMSSGPVPLFPGNSKRPGQAHASGLTTCRRLALQMVLGLAAERDDDFNSEPETQPRQAAAPRQAQGQQQAARTVTTPNRQQRAAGGPAAGAARTAPTRQGPPPGWLSREERAALEQELMDPNITPERFQEIEAKLRAANNLSQAAAAPAQGQQP
jgi:hypothetical protein